mgnify:CR=1 FL=1
MAWGPKGHRCPPSPEHQVPILQTQPHEVFGFATLLWAHRGRERDGDNPVPSLELDTLALSPLTVPCHSSSPSVLLVLSSSSMVSCKSGALQREGPGMGAEPGRAQHHGCKNAVGARMQWVQEIKGAEMQWIQERSKYNAMGARMQWVQG